MTNATAEKNLVLMSQDEVMERLVLPQGLKATPIQVGARPRIVKDGDGYNVQFSRGSPGFSLLTAEGKDALFDFTGIPKGLAKSTPEKLMLPVLEHQLAALDRVVAISDDENGLLRLQRQTDMRPVLAPAQVLEQVYQQFPEVMYQRAERSDNYAFDVLAITHNQVQRLETLLAPGQHKFLPRGGDPFRAGVHMRFSPLGTVAPMIEPYTVRLVCTNGAISAQFMSAWGKGYGEGDEMWQWFRQGLEDSGRRVSEIMGNFAELVGEEIPPGEGRMLAVNGAIRDARLPKAQADAVMAMALANPPRTAYDIFNFMTAVATHQSQTFGEQLRRMAVAGRQAQPGQHARFCPTCNRG